MTHQLNQDSARPTQLQEDKTEVVSGTSRRDFLSAAGALVVSVASGSLPTEAFAQLPPQVALWARRWRPSAPSSLL